MSLRDVGKVKDTADIELRHPVTGAPLLHADGTPMTITVCGPYSEQYKRILREQQQKRVADLALGKARDTVLSSDEIEQGIRDLAMRCIVAWDITLEGEDRPEATPENIQAVADEFPWVFEQVRVAVLDSAHFFEMPKPT